MDDGPLRDFQDDAFAVLAVASSLSAFLTVSGGKFPPMAIIVERVQTLVDFKDHIAAPAAIASIRSSVGDIFFTAEADMTVAALAGTNDDFCSVCKHNDLLLKSKKLREKYIPQQFLQS